MRPALTLPRYPAVLVACLVLGLSTTAFAFQPPPAPGAGEALGPGINVRFPDDPSLGPFLGSEGGLGATDPNAPAQITPKALETLRPITEVYDRSRALRDTARVAILRNQIQLAHQKLEEASLTALKEPNPLRHDQELVEMIMTTAALTDAIIREGRPQGFLPGAAEPAAEPLPKRLPPKVSIQLVRLEWQRAGVLAHQIKNPTYRNEYEERVAEGMSRDSSQIVLTYVLEAESPENLPGTKKPTPEEIKDYQTGADALLVEAQEIARRIEWPLWKNQALERIAINAGESRQYDRAVAVAGSIGNAEARAQGLILVAESQCRHDQASAATKTYAEAAEAISKVERIGLRGVLTGYLVDSLISNGRFEDARACLVLYPTRSERFVALGAIAESQGRRGAADSALEWIAREAPPEYKSALYRRVNNGVMTAIVNEGQSQTGVQLPLPPRP
jgi:hypothetical protein